MKITQKAFTLIELLIVAAIIGVLTALVIVVINPEQLRREARDVNRKKDLALISSALEQYYADNNEYPNNAIEVDLTCLGTYLEGGSVDTDCNGTIDPSEPTSAPVYLNSMPTSQTDTANEYCYVGTDAQNYSLCAPIEADLLEVPSIVTSCVPISPSEVTTGTYCIENPF